MLLINFLFQFQRVFTTVVSGLGEFFSPGREAKITSNYISEVSDEKHKTDNTVDKS